jgi:hypothetical protein
MKRSTICLSLLQRSFETTFCCLLCLQSVPGLYCSYKKLETLFSLSIEDIFSEDNMLWHQLEIWQMQQTSNSYSLRVYDLTKKWQLWFVQLSVLSKIIYITDLWNFFKRTLVTKLTRQFGGMRSLEVREKNSNMCLFYNPVVQPYNGFDSNT